MIFDDIVRARVPSHRGRLRTLATLATLALGASAFAACGNLTVGGQEGEVEVTVSGDAPEGAASGAAQGAWGDAAAVARQDDDDEPEGEIEVEFQLFLVTEGGRSVRLTDQDLRVRVDVRGQQEADVLRRTVDATDYAELQVVFTDIEVEVESGLIVDGVPIVGEIDVELEDGSVTVARPIDLTVPEGGTVQLLIDLNTTTWIRAVDPDLRRVAQAIFRDAIRIVVR